MAIQASLIPMFSRSLPFYGTIAHGDPAWAGPALSAMTLAQALSLPGWILLSRRLSSQGTMRIAYGLMIAGIILLQMPDNLPTDLIPLALIGISNGGINMAIWALLAISIRQGNGCGAGSEALPIGIFLATLKACSGIGGAILSLAVSWQDIGCGSCGGGSPILWSAYALPVLGSILCLGLLARTEAPESH